MSIKSATPYLLLLGKGHEDARRKNARIFTMSFASVYPLYVQKDASAASWSTYRASSARDASSRPACSRASA